MPIAVHSEPEQFAPLFIPEGLRWAHPVVQEWFVGRFGTPTEPQEQGWPRILERRPTLISAPTGSGKTLAAFLICIDRLLRKAIEGTLECETEVVYVSPLKALSNDIQKNLERAAARDSGSGLGARLLCRRRFVPGCAPATRCRRSGAKC